ncbi:hypothetical protein F2Q69_00063629 [Brassica cretica]|uniref:Uncharacterized protein n=1 Tax=Brassica cretica TaxID=69181 RepID=A0A8S9RJS5_BRACR|nr:hypothetical protein F2Q69_00063629 [Brassica cretica]
MAGDTESYNLKNVTEKINGATFTSKWKRIIAMAEQKGRLRSDDSDRWKRRFARVFSFPFRLAEENTGERKRIWESWK